MLRRHASARLWLTLGVLALGAWLLVLGLLIRG